MLSLFCITRPYTVLVAVALTAILGTVSVVNMTTDLLPNINLPYAVIVTTYIGASPEQVEAAVTKPIEQAMASISNIRAVRSISGENLSTVILEFTGNTNMDSAVIEMREGLDMIEPFLPETARSPVILKLNPEMMPLMVLSAAVEGKSAAETSSIVENIVAPALESVEGIASVSTTGLVQQQIIVRLNQERISQTKGQVQGALMGALLSSSRSPGENLSSVLSGSLLDPSSLLNGLMGIGSMSSRSAGQQAVADSLDSQLDPNQLVSAETISAILMGHNFQMPAGYATDEDTRYLVRVGDAIKSLEELRSLPIFAFATSDIDPVVLQDIADIIVADNSDEIYAKVNGKDAVILTVQKQTEYATSTVSKDILDKIDELRKDHPEVELVPLMDQGQYIKMAVGAITNNLLIGALLAIAILLLFLRDIRPTLIVALSIPISLIAAFALMYFSNVSLNVMSMGGLALAVGMLVDNSIVVIENIFRLRADGKSPLEAAAEGAAGVTGAIIASTLTTVVVFLPVIFTQGLIRQLFTDMGLTIAFSLLASLIVSVGLIPTVAARIKNTGEPQHNKAVERFKESYSKALSYALDHKALVISLVVILFAGSAFGVLSTGTELIPSTDTGQIMVTVDLPKGSTLEETAQAADTVASIIQDIPEVETVGAIVASGLMGSGMPGVQQSDPDSCSMYVLLRDKRSRSTVEVAQEIRSKTAGTEFQVTVSDSTMDISALTGNTIAVQIKGRDLDTLTSLARSVADVVRSIPGTTNVSDGQDHTSPELRVIVDKARSLAHGLTVAQVFMEVSKLLASDSAVTTIPVGSRDVSVYVQDAGSTAPTADDISELVIPTPLDTEVPLSDIATVEKAIGPQWIRHESQQRYVTVTAELEEGYNVGKVSSQINRKLADMEVPEGYSLSMEGEQALLEQSYDDLFLMLVLAVIFIYLIMVVQFQSLLSPFVVMFSIPLAFTGGFLALAIAGVPVSMPALIGFVVLSGVVVNNAIVFVDYANQLVADGMEKRDALIKTGNDRLRPILMTALTTILALAATSLGLGQGAEIMQPVAITSIGGLLYATALTLLFIPVLYDAFVREKTPGDMVDASS